MAAALLAAFAVIVSTNSAAQGLQNYNEDGGLVRGKVAPATMGAKLFGDSWSAYTGSVEFNQTDVSLPGNSKLSVAISRRLMTGVVTWQEPASEASRGFADWELDIPYIRTTVARTEGWQVGFPGNPTENNKRCTNFDEELVPAHSESGNLVALGFPIAMLQVPGGGSEELLRPSGGYPFPSDGRTYRALSKGGWVFTCVNLAGPSGAVGEGFIAVAPDGTQYKFDWMVKRNITIGYGPAGGGALMTEGSTTSGMSAQQLGGGSVVSPMAAVQTTAVARAEVRLLPTRITDRHGNWVDYNWSASNPWQLQSITSSDGRTLTLGYVGALIDSVTDGTRTWTYGYEGTSGEPHNVAATRLKTVLLPDNSTWQFSGSSLQFDPGLPKACNGTGGMSGTVSKTITHPSGAQGVFTFKRRDGPFTVGNCKDANGYYSHRLDYSGLALTTKALSGSGLSATTWTYGDYVTAGDRASFVVTEPNGNQSRYTFGITFQGNEGQLLQQDDGWNGSTALRTTTYRYRSETAGPYAAQFGYSSDTSADGQTRTFNRPQDQRTTTQQGTSFTWEATAFDTLARATTVAKSGPGISRSETTTFEDNTTKWVMGQLKKLTVTKDSVTKTEVENGYNATTANLENTSKYGKFQNSFTYHGDGNLATRTDGRNYSTSFNSYKRGLAQAVSYPNSTSESAVVNDIGLVTSVTGAAGHTISYGYDAAGRLASITPPSGWTGTNLSFTPVASAEYGLPAGHWKQTITRGSAVTETYFDALWRPVMMRTYDANQPSTTRKVVVKQFDADGRTVYESYPKRDIASVTATPGGVSSVYDALGRATSCQRRSNIDPPCRFNIDPGMDADRLRVGCG